MTLQILVLDGDAGLRTQICAHLSNIGMTARGVGDARQLDQALADPSAAIVVCAADLPESDGYAVAARLRISTGAGIVMLMPDDRRESRILGLSIGVDHCMSKPVDLDELGMVLRNLQRRQRAKPTTPAATPEPANAANIDVADWQFDPNRWSLSFAQGPRVQLSMAEMLILQYLIGAAGQVASRDQLLRMLGHHGIRVYSRNLDAMISRLRKKTERVTGQRLAVLSARNIGYVFTGTCEVAAAPAVEKPAASVRHLVPHAGTRRDNRAARVA